MNVALTRPLRKINNLDRRLGVESRYLFGDRHAVGNPSRSFGADGETIFETGNTRYANIAVSILGSFMIDSVRDHQHFVPERGKTVRFKIGLRRNATMSGFRRIFL